MASVARSCRRRFTRCSRPTHDQKVLTAWIADWRIYFFSGSRTVSTLQFRGEEFLNVELANHGNQVTLAVGDGNGPLKCFGARIRKCGFGFTEVDRSQNFQSTGLWPRTISSNENAALVFRSRNFATSKSTSKKVVDEEIEETIESSLHDDDNLDSAEREEKLALREQLTADIVTSVTDPMAFATAQSSKYFLLSREQREKLLGSALPKGLLQEFDGAKSTGILVRENSLQLLNLIERAHTQLVEASQVGAPLAAPDRSSESPDSEAKPTRRSRIKRRHFLLEGAVGSGKSFALATAVIWARANGWLTFYVPSAREWTHGGLYYKHQDSVLWDTPVQAREVLFAFRDSHSELLATLPLRVHAPLTLGEGPGTGLAKDSQVVTLKKGSSLLDLVQQGIDQQESAVSVVVRLRHELALVTEVPVLIAIDEYNVWFTYSEYHESVGSHYRRRPIHACEMRMVDAFRPMMGNIPLANGITVAAFSASVATGQLPDQLPGVPKKVRFEVPRLSMKEMKATVQYYRSRGVIKHEPEESALNTLYFLTNGNGAEIRKLTYLL